MPGLQGLFGDPNSVAANIFVMALVIASGLALGGVRWRGVRFGVAGVLFTGLVVGHFQLFTEHEVLEFLREFGLILFVYAVGLSVGPGFFNAMKAQGLKLNLLAAGIVGLGMVLTLVIHFVGSVAMPLAVGVFCGATTNTPALAAAGQSLREHPPAAQAAVAAVAQAAPDVAAELAKVATLDEPQRHMLQAETTKLPGLAYALTYPMGVFGIILTLVVLPRFLRDPPRLEPTPSTTLDRGLQRLNLRVTNPNLAGRELGRIPSLEALQVAISRVQRGGEVFLATPEFRLAVGDVILAIGSARHLDELRLIVGEPADVDLMQEPSDLTVRWLAITRKEHVGESVPDLQVTRKFGVQVTRVRRAEVELPPIPEVRLGLGDQILVVGPPDAVAAVAREVGDNPKKLAEPQLIPVFVGIALGILLGSLPLMLPGMASSIKLGLAGGPLIVAILLSRFQRIGSLVWYLPTSASLMLKDLGIVLFLAAVGIKSGDRFVATLTTGDGLWWLGAGVAVTLVPLFVVGWLAHHFRWVTKLELAGLLAGSMTDPPALAFAQGQYRSEVPSVTYATVYPLTMILRVIAAQVMISVWAV